MTNRLVCIALAATICCVGAQTQIRPQTQTVNPRLVFGKAPGQAEAWIAHGAQHSVLIDATGALIQMEDRPVRLRFTGANSAAPVTPDEKQPGHVNYLIGRDPSKWIKDEPTYGRIRFAQVYPSTDVVWYGSEGKLEYDLMLGAGADPSAVRMHVDGAGKITLKDGGVEIQAGKESLELRPPVVYQDRDGKRVHVDCGYELLANGDVGFKLDAYDRSRAVVIDPVLLYGSYVAVGGRITTDAKGNVYAAGSYLWTYVPVTRDAQPGFRGNRTIAAAKYNAGGELQYATFIGGGPFDTLAGIAVGNDGRLVITGSEGDGQQFPYTMPPTNPQDLHGFVLKLTPDGDGFAFAVPIAGSPDAPGAVAVDHEGNTYVTGQWPLTPTPGAYQSPVTAGFNDGFLIKYSASGSVVYSAAPPGNLQAQAMVLDQAGNAYVAGSIPFSSLPSFPAGTAGITRKGGPNDASWFVYQMSADGSKLGWASLLAAATPFANFNGLTAMARDASTGLLYITGTTTATDVPTTPNAFQRTMAPGASIAGLLASITPDGMQFPAVTYLNGAQAASGIAVTANGVVVVGLAGSAKLPVKAPIQGDAASSPITLAKSQDAGATWTNLNALPEPPLAIWIDPQQPSVILAFSTDHVFRSSDAGLSWTKVFDSSLSFAVSPDGSALYLSGYPVGLYRSLDRGATWTQITTNASSLPSPFAFPAQTISINPANPNDIVVVGAFFFDGVARSLDGGVTFQALPGRSPSGDIWSGWLRSFTDEKGDILVASYNDGVNRSSDRGKTWITNTPANSFVSAAAQSSSRLQTVYAELFPGGLYRTDDFGLTWKPVNDRVDITAITVSPSSPNTVYISDLGGDILKSTDGGVTFSALGTGVDGSFVAGLAIDPSNQSRLYLANSPSYGSFITKFDKSLTKLVWSTYFGDANTDLQSAAPVPGCTTVWVSGRSSGATPGTKTQGNGPGFLAHVSDETLPCSYLVTPEQQYVYYTQAFSAAVTAPSGCGFSTHSDVPWIFVKHGETGEGSEHHQCASGIEQHGRHPHRPPPHWGQDDLNR